VRPRPLFLLAAAAALLAGCGGGSSPSQAPVLTHRAETPAIGVGELAAMVLPRTSFGLPADRLTLDRHLSGKLTARAAATLTLDPDDSGRQLKHAKRQAGYVLSFASASRPARDTLSVGSGVELFSTAEGASGRLAGEIAAYRKLTNRDGPATSQRARAVFFPVPGVGDRAYGIRLNGRTGGASWVTLVHFQHDDVVGTVTLSRRDATDMRIEATALAHVLDQRIAGVLSRSIPPVARPLPEPKWLAARKA
jgi:hypothetical protein